MDHIRVHGSGIPACNFSHHCGRSVTNASYRHFQCRLRRCKRSHSEMNGVPEYFLVADSPAV